MFGRQPSPEGAESGPDEPVAEHRGVNVHAKQSVDGRDRRQLERLCRYITRPPVAQERLARLHDGSLELTLKHAWKDGTRAVVLEPDDPMVRLVAAVARAPSAARSTKACVARATHAAVRTARPLSPTVRRGEVASRGGAGRRLGGEDHSVFPRLAACHPISARPATSPLPQPRPGRPAVATWICRGADDLGRRVTSIEIE